MTDNELVINRGALIERINERYLFTILTTYSNNFYFEYIYVNVMDFPQVPISSIR